MSTHVTRSDYNKAIQNQVSRLFEPFFNRAAQDQEDLVTGTWAPPVDVAEDADKILVRAELPGMKREDIEIRFEDGMLTLSGERQFEKKTNERNYHRVERAYGTFVRSFTLPRSVDPERISAAYRDGILDIEIPKREEAKPKKITINISEPKKSEAQPVIETKKP